MNHLLKEASDPKWNRHFSSANNFGLLSNLKRSFSLPSFYSYEDWTAARNTGTLPSSFHKEKVPPPPMQIIKTQCPALSADCAKHAVQLSVSQRRGSACSPRVLPAHVLGGPRGWPTCRGTGKKAAMTTQGLAANCLSQWCTFAIRPVQCDSSIKQPTALTHQSPSRRGLAASVRTCTLPRGAADERKELKSRKQRSG